MNISWLTLRDLEYLVTVARLNHFGKAAESCRVSQPTLSAQIKKIEDFLDVTLFERTNKRIAITEVGTRVVEQANIVLEEAQKILHVLDKEKAPLSGALRLGAISTLGPFLIPKFLGPLRRKYPSLQLLITEGLTEPLLKDLRDGKLDVVVAARTFVEDGLQVFPLFFEPFVVAAPTHHPLTKKIKLRTSDLNSEHMILMEDGHCLRDQALDTCPPNRRGQTRAFHATSIETLRHLVASGLGYTLMPKLATRDRTMKDLVEYREFDQGNVGREIVLVCRERYPAKRDVEILAAFLKKYCSDS